MFFQASLTETVQLRGITLNRTEMALLEETVSQRLNKIEVRQGGIFSDVCILISHDVWLPGVFFFANYA